MAGESVSALSLTHLPTLCRVGVVGNLSDGELLASFLTGREEAAEASFAALVDRHGPMVLRVCRQILGNADDARGCVPGHVSGAGPTGWHGAQA